MTTAKLSKALMINDHGEIVPRLTLADALRKKTFLERLERKPCAKCGKETVFRVCGDCSDKDPGGAA